MNCTNGGEVEARERAAMPPALSLQPTSPSPGVGFVSEGRVLVESRALSTHSRENTRDHAGMLSEYIQPTSF